MAALTARHRGRPAELLLVEDNYGDVLLTREAFRRAKIANNLTVAGDGEEALSMLRRESPHTSQSRPDLILLDLNLPRMDGRELLQTLKADPELQSIPVILLTGSMVNILKTDDLQANGRITKPIDFERLKEIVASLESLWFMVMVFATEPARG